MIKAYSQKTASKVQRRTLAHHRNHHSSQDAMPHIKEATKVPQSMSISPDKSGIPREPTIQSCKHLNDITTSKLSTFSPVDSPFKNSTGMKTSHLKSLKPFNSAVKNATGTLERSLRKLNPVKRNISSTISNDQLTQVDSNFSSANEKLGDADFSDQVDFTHTSFVGALSTRKDTPPRHNMSKPSEKMYKRW